MIPCSDIPCSALATFGSQTDQRCSFAGDSDIAGIGVLLSFIIPGTITYMISVYMFFFVPSGFSIKLTNTLDSKVVETTNYLMEGTGYFMANFMARTGQVLRKKSPVVDAASKELHWWSSFKSTLSDVETLSQILIMLSDQQLVLGFSILIVGYVKFRTMTEYHFAIVSALSNISFVVHVSTVPVVVRAMFDKHTGDANNAEWSNKWYNFRKLWRATAKIVFDILLFISFVPTGNRWWLVNYGLPTNCVWHNTKGNYSGLPKRTMIADMVLLSWGIAYELHAFFPIFAEEGRASKLLERVVWLLLVPRHLLLWITDRAEKPTSPLLRCLALLFQPILRVLTVFVFVCCEVTASQTLRLTRSWAMLISNSVRIFKLRTRAELEGRIENEDAWSYGQTLSMFLLLLPTFLAFELCYDKYMEQREGAHRKRGSVSTEQSSRDGSGEHQQPPSPPPDPPPGYHRPSRVDTEQRIGETPPLARPPGVVFRNARLAVFSRSVRTAPTSTIGQLVQTASQFTLVAGVAEQVLRTNCFYFGFPDRKLEAYSLEKGLYSGLWFSHFVVSLMFLIFVTVTVWAIKGWAF